MKNFFTRRVEMPQVIVEAKELHHKLIVEKYTLSNATDAVYQHYLNNFDSYTDFPYLSNAYTALQNSWLTGDTHFLHPERLRRRMKDFDDLHQEFNKALTHDYTAERSTPPMLAGKQYRERVLISPQDALPWERLPSSSVTSWANSVHGVSLSDSRALGLFCQRIIPSRYSNVSSEFHTDVMAMREYNLNIHNIDHYISALDKFALDCGFATSSTLSPMVSDALVLDPSAVGTWFKQMHQFVHSLPEIVQHLHPLYENAVNYLVLVIMHTLTQNNSSLEVGMGSKVVPASKRKNPDVAWQQKPVVHHFPAGKDTAVVDVWDVVTDVLYDHEDKYDAGLEFSTLMSQDGHHFVAEGYGWLEQDFISWKKNHDEIQDLEKFLL